MKKILTFLCTITLIGTSTTSLVACNTPQEYTPEELAKLKEENKIKTNNKEIRDNLEWIAPQEKPFNTVDNKWYFVVWRGEKTDDWRIIKFKNDTSTKTIDNLGNQYSLNLGSYLDIRTINLYVYKSGFTGFTQLWVENNNYIRTVYRWNNDSEPNIDVENKLKSYLGL